MELIAKRISNALNQSTGCAVMPVFKGKKLSAAAKAFDTRGLETQAAACDGVRSYGTTSISLFCIESAKQGELHSSSSGRVFYSGGDGARVEDDEAINYFADILPRSAPRTRRHAASSASRSLERPFLCPAAGGTP